MPTGSHGWDVEHSLSDRQLARMLGALRKAGSFETGSSGTLSDTGIPRTNQDGSLDEPESSICPSCVLL